METPRYIMLLLLSIPKVCVTWIKTCKTFQMTPFMASSVYVVTHFNPDLCYFWTDMDNPQLYQNNRLGDYFSETRRFISSSSGIFWISTDSLTRLPLRRISSKYSCHSHLETWWWKSIYQNNGLDEYFLKGKKYYEVVTSLVTSQTSFMIMFFHHQLLFPPRIIKIGQ